MARSRARYQIEERKGKLINMKRMLLVLLIVSLVSVPALGNEFLSQATFERELERVVQRFYDGETLAFLSFMVNTDLTAKQRFIVEYTDVVCSTDMYGIKASLDGWEKITTMSLARNEHFNFEYINKNRWLESSSIEPLYALLKIGAMLDMPYSSSSYVFDILVLRLQKHEKEHGELLNIDYEPDPYHAIERLRNEWRSR